MKFPAFSDGKFLKAEHLDNIGKYAFECAQSVGFGLPAGFIRACAAGSDRTNRISLDKNSLQIDNLAVRGANGAFFVSPQRLSSSPREAGLSLLRVQQSPGTDAPMLVGAEDGGNLVGGLDLALFDEEGMAVILPAATTLDAVSLQNESPLALERAGLEKAAREAGLVIESFTQFAVDRLLEMARAHAGGGEGGRQGADALLMEAENVMSLLASPTTPLRELGTAFEALARRARGLALRVHAWQHPGERWRDCLAFGEAMLETRLCQLAVDEVALGKIVKELKPKRPPFESLTEAVQFFRTWPESWLGSEGLVRKRLARREGQIDGPVEVNPPIHPVGDRLNLWRWDISGVPVGTTFVLDVSGADFGGLRVL